MPSAVPKTAKDHTTVSIWAEKEINNILCKFLLVLCFWLFTFFPCFDQWQPLLRCNSRKDSIWRRNRRRRNYYVNVKCITRNKVSQCKQTHLGSQIHQLVSLQQLHQSLTKTKLTAQHNNYYCLSLYSNYNDH